MFVSSAALAAGAALCAAVSLSQPMDVAYSGYLILRVRTPVWGLSCSERANVVTRRFASLVNEGFRAERREVPLPHPSAQTCHRNWCVLAGNAVLVTVTGEDARANNTSARALAGIWADHLDRALRLAVGYVSRICVDQRVTDAWVVDQVLARMGPVALAPSPLKACGPGMAVGLGGRDGAAPPQAAEQADSAEGLRDRVRSIVCRLW